MGFLVFALFAYLLLQTILSLLFYVYLWQLKEYRTDRFLCHLGTKSGQKQVLAYFNIMLWKGALRPSFTLKAVLIFLIALSLGIRSWFYFLKLLYFNFSLRILLASVFLNFLAPFLVSLVVILFQPPTLLMKKLIIAWAKRKMARFPKLIVIGITGSFGKSSTKEILATLLSEKFRVLKTPQNWNSEIGVAKTILYHLKPEHQVFVVEMAAYKKGEIKQICQMVGPSIGILTGIDEQHLGLFGSLKNTMSAKYELVESLPETGLAVFNADNPYSLQLSKKTRKKKKFYSLEGAEKIKVGREKIAFEFDGRSWQLNLLGLFHVSNFLAAMMVASELGVKPGQVNQAVRKLQPLEGTMKPFRGIKGAFFIDDTYNSNPQGFMAALAYLEKQKGRKVVITPGIIELGKASRKIHQEIGQRLAAIADWLIITKKDFARDLTNNHPKVSIEEDWAELVLLLKRKLKKADLVLLEGRLPPAILRRLR